MQIFFINLDRRSDRRAAMEAKLAKVGLAAERIAAVTPDDVSAEQREQYCNPMRSHHMRVGELCCSLSHIKTLKAFLATEESHCLVLEDDVVFSPKLPAFLAALEQDGTHCDILRLETDLNGQRLMPVSEQVIGPVEIKQNWSWCAGSAAYVINRKAADVIIAKGYFLRAQTDAALFNPYKPLARRVVIKHCVPGLAVQEDRLYPEVQDSDLVAHRATEWQIPWWLKAWRAVAGPIETEIVHGSQRQFHIVFGGARKRIVPFAQ